MANHLRQQIREAIGTKVTGLTTTGARVYQSRIYPLSDDELPCLLISSLQEQIVSRSEGSWAASVPRITARTLTVVVKAVAKVTSNLDDILDTICKEVEAVLAADRFLSGLTDDLVLNSTQISLNGDGEKPLGVAEMVWDCTYWCNETTPDVKN